MRKQLIYGDLINTDITSLEIGAFVNPVISGNKNLFVDAFSKQDLIKNHGLTSEEMINRVPEIDIIWDGSVPLSILLKNKVDLVFASHVFEHIPNPIKWLNFLLNCISNIGHISLIVPNKSYCFDVLRPYTSIGDIIDAFELDRKRPSLGQVIDQRFYSRRLDNKNSWSKSINYDFNDLKPPYSKDVKNKLINNLTNDYRNNKYIDTHCWCFSPKNIYTIFNELKNQSYIKFNDLFIHEFDSDFLIRLK